MPLSIICAGMGVVAIVWRPRRRVCSGCGAVELLAVPLANVFEGLSVLGQDVPLLTLGDCEGQFRSAQAN